MATMAAAAGVFVGALVARWWSVVLAVPVGVIASTMLSLEGLSGTEVGVLSGIVTAIGLVIGTALRKVVASLDREQ